VRGERIVWVGNEADAREHVEPHTDVIDASGKLVLPGTVDSHNHVRLGSNRDAQLAGTTTLREAHRRMAAFLAVHPLGHEPDGGPPHGDLGPHDGRGPNFCDQDRGSVTPGKHADLIILSRDLFQLPPKEILETRVELTMVGGRIEYRV
jgi:predicted amidohydrolase YtcJ